MEKEWKIPVTVEKCGLLIIKAKTLEEAMNIVRNNEDDDFYEKMIDEEYVESSLHLSEENADIIGKCYNNIY